tara:strand:+ start:2042 stop:3070 length:1029 start_codon:yes stop_codon:yes gene_type:complete
MQLSPGKLMGMKRLSGCNGIFLMTAVDQRPPIKNPIRDHLKVSEAPWQEVAKFKRALIDSLQEYSSALLLDPHFALPFSMDIFDPRKGLVVTLEDSAFIETKNGRISKNIDDWNVSKIKRMGADAVKVLAWYRPDADKEVLEQQKDYIQRVGEDCAKYDILFLLELLVYPLPKLTNESQTTEYKEMKNKKKEHVFRSIEEFAKEKYRVDIFKLESPVNAELIDRDDLDTFKEMGRIAARPWVMLSAGVSKAEFKKVLSLAFQAGCSGFLAGRAIWLEALANYPDWEKIDTVLRGSSATYLSEIVSLAEQQAMPWHKHECFTKGGNLFPYKTAKFRHLYMEND